MSASVLQTRPKRPVGGPPKPTDVDIGDGRHVLGVDPGRGDIYNSAAAAGTLYGPDDHHSMTVRKASNKEYRAHALRRADVRRARLERRHDIHDILLGIPTACTAIYDEFRDGHVAYILQSLEEITTFARCCRGPVRRLRVHRMKA